MTTKKSLNKFHQLSPYSIQLDHPIKDRRADVW